MIGYYMVILTSAMVLIVIGIRLFKMLTARKQQAEVRETTSVSDEESREVETELAAAAIAAVSALLASERTTASAWSFVGRSPYSVWKLANRSRRVSPAGG
jgi:uncharacterized membrane protein